MTRPGPGRAWTGGRPSATAPPDRSRRPAPSAHLVPGGHRWHVDPGGQAWNGGLDEPLPGATCRVPHQLTCPGLSLDEIRPWRWLDAVREENARRALRQTDGTRRPEALPDAG
ncbi:DUF6083 domain-containing protein [Streptomyces sp. KO7888]|uniref:DUF6083 domain-containing protein n=1 Tax=Streptomyces sp. KO7888 TaxID=2602737 RepID=UPI001F61E499|nr:DUF6083 domain-containing protein [Streptomyces sp. KO7888]